MSYIHNGFRQMRIFTKWPTSIKSSWVEIGLVELILLTKHFHIIYALCLTRNTQKNIPNVECSGQAKGALQQENKCSPHTGHWAGRSSPVPSCCMALRSPTLAGWWGEPRTHAQVETRTLHWNTNLPSPHFLKTLTLFLSFQTRHCQGQQLFPMGLYETQENDYGLMRASSMLICSVGMRSAHDAGALLAKRETENRPPAAEFSGGRGRRYF